MTKVLLFTGESGQFRYYEEVVARLKPNGVHVDICCDRDDPGIYDLLREGAERLGAGFSYHDGDAAIPKQSRVHKWSEALFFGWLRRNPVYRECRAQLTPTLLDHMIRFHRYRLSSAERIIAKSGAEIVLVPEDGIGGNYWAVAAALRLGRTVAVLPFGMGDSSFLYKGVEEKHTQGVLCHASTPQGRVIEKHWPQWLHDSAYGRVTLLPPEFIAGMEFAGVHLPRPWTLQGGCAHAVLVEGEAMKRRYLAESIPDSKLLDAGTVYCDLLYDGLMQTGKDESWLRKGRRHDTEKFKILVCVPPGESDFWVGRSQFASVSDYCRALNDFCHEDPRFDIVFSFHPRMLPDDVARLTDVGIVSDPQSVVKLIPASDVLVVSLSSVARWGLVARRPSVDFDLFNSHMPRFQDCGGYLYCKRFEQVKILLRRLCDDDIFYREVSLGCASVADGFDKIDGHAAEKLAGSIKALIESGDN